MDASMTLGTQDLLLIFLAAAIACGVIGYYFGMRAEKNKKHGN